MIFICQNKQISILAFVIFIVSLCWRGGKYFFRVEVIFFWGGGMFDPHLWPDVKHVKNGIKVYSALHRFPASWFYLFAI